MQSIPKLDLSHFTHGSDSQKHNFVNELGYAYEHIGFVAIRNHGIPNEVLTDLYREVKNFFDLSERVKMQYDDSMGGGQRGYTGFGKEHAKNRNAGDLKEFWHFGQYTEGATVEVPSYAANKVVAELPSFNKAGETIYKALEETGIQILRAIALHLALDENYFDDKVRYGNSILRAIHYPPITGDPKDAIRAGEHEDINLITLLVGASADGLEVLNKNGDWIGVTEVEDHIVVNVGDMLQRLTNDQLKSTTHRVVNPPQELWGTPRYSIPFFLHPRPEVRLDCLPQCISEESPKKYEDCSAMEFLIQRLREIGLIK
jgi:isopenicillin N synthase-like dioxygenase